MSTAVIFHAQCYDGLTSAWIAWREFGSRAQYFPVGFYDKELPKFSEPTMIFILDFSYPVEVIEAWVKDGHQVILLDHHQSAIDKLKPYFDQPRVSANAAKAVFDNNRSGAGITCDFFMQARTTLVNLVEDRDLWRFHYGNKSRFLYSYMQNKIEFSDPLEKSFETLSIINQDLDSSHGTVMEQGEVLAESYYKFRRGFADNLVYVHIPGWGPEKFPVLTTNKMFGADTCGYILKELKFQVAGYFFLEKPFQWNWGMRSTPEHDIAELCSRYGGGGHKQSAGFMVTGASPFPVDWKVVG